jgi:WhiB family redox-sensing transcriptional regulator
VDLDLLAALMRSAPGDLEPVTLADLLHRPVWHAEAACRGRGTDGWFPVQGRRPDDARAVCGACPVLEECHRWALDQGPELAGVWAGLTEADRRQLRRTAA